MKKWIIKGERVVKLLLQHAWLVPQKIKTKLQVLGIALGLVHEIIKDTSVSDQEQDTTAMMDKAQQEEDSEI